MWVYFHKTKPSLKKKTFKPAQPVYSGRIGNNKKPKSLNVTAASEGPVPILEGWGQNHELYGF